MTRTGTITLLKYYKQHTWYNCSWREFRLIHVKFQCYWWGIKSEQLVIENPQTYLTVSRSHVSCNVAMSLGVYYQADKICVINEEFDITVYYENDSYVIRGRYNDEAISMSRQSICPYRHLRNTIQMLKTKKV